MAAGVTQLRAGSGMQGEAQVPPGGPKEADQRTGV